MIESSVVALHSGVPGALGGSEKQQQNKIVYVNIEYGVVYMYIGMCMEQHSFYYQVSH